MLAQISPSSPTYLPYRLTPELPPWMNLPFNIILYWWCSVFFSLSSLLTLTSHLRQRRPKKVSTAPISARFPSGRQHHSMHPALGQ